LSSVHRDGVDSKVTQLFNGAQYDDAVASGDGVISTRAHDDVTVWSHDGDRGQITEVRAKGGVVVRQLGHFSLDDGEVDASEFNVVHRSAKAGFDKRRSGE
jgi:hypothetical protein